MKIRKIRFENNKILGDIEFDFTDANGKVIDNIIIAGENGLIFPVNDHKALSERILWLVNDEKLRGKLSHNSRESFEKEYDMRKNIKSLDMLFRKYATIK